MNISAKEYRNQVSKKKNKYNAVKIGCDGHDFDSKAEYQYYLVLKDRLKHGEITDLEVHPEFKLDVNGWHIRDYTADFKFTDLSLQDGPNRVVIDIKSPQTANKDGFRMVCKLMWAIYSIEVVVIIEGIVQKGKPKKFSDEPETIERFKREVG